MKNFSISKEDILRRFKECAILFWKEYGCEEDSVEIKDGDKDAYITLYDYEILMLLESELK